MAKQKKPDEQDPQNQPPQGDPGGGDPGNEFVAGGENPTGEPDKPQEQPQEPTETTPPVTGEGEKPQTIVVDEQGQKVEGPEITPEEPKVSEPVKKETSVQAPAEPTPPPPTEQTPEYMAHKSGMQIPFSDFEDDNIVWAEKFDPATKKWDAKKFSRRTWDLMTAGKARRFRGQPHSGWTRLIPSLPEWDALNDPDDLDNPDEGGEGRVGPRPGDRNNP